LNCLVDAAIEMVTPGLTRHHRRFAKRHLRAFGSKNGHVTLPVLYKAAHDAASKPLRSASMNSNQCCSSKLMLEDSTTARILNSQQQRLTHAAISGHCGYLDDDPYGLLCVRVAIEPDEPQ